jgi:hypothetical protein
MRLSAGGIDAPRYAGQRQLTRWGARELSPTSDSASRHASGAMRPCA